MASKTTRDLILNFERADGKTHSMTIPDYKPDLTKETIEASTAIIIAQGIFTPDGFPLTKAINAVKVDTTKTNIDLEETQA